MGQFELRNLMTAPATDGALIDALLAFSNGDDVVIVGQPDENLVRRWSLFREASTSAEREAHVDLLDQFAQQPDSIGPPMAKVIRFPVLSKRSGIKNILPQDFALYFGHMRVSLEFEPILVARPQGYSSAMFRQFNNVAGLLAFATLLVMDDKAPHGKALCRCKLPSCQRFYLARKNPAGGPANRTYCEPKHRDAHHNSAGRKAVSRRSQ